MITPVSLNNSPKKQSFRGLGKMITNSKPYDKLTDGIAQGIANIYKTPAVEKTIQSMATHFKKPAARMGDLASFVYTLSILKNTAESKKIEKDRKPMLMINAVLMTVVSSTVAAIVDKYTDPVMIKMNDAYKNAYDNKKLVGDITNWLKPGEFSRGLSKMKSLSIFTVAVRLVIPLLMVPVTGAIVKKLRANKEAKEKAAQETRNQRAFEQIRDAKQATATNNQEIKQV